MNPDRMTDRSAYIVFAVALTASLIAAAFAPQDTQLGAWVKFVIWHGMLKWACIVVIYGMGVLALGHLLTGRRVFYEWAHAMQVATLPAWAFAVTVGAVAARLVWNSFNWTEQRMTMSLLYIMVTAVALVIGLLVNRPRVTSALIVVSSLTMVAGMAWITFFPSPDSIHPAAAVMGADDPMFRVFALLMLAGTLVSVLAAVVPVRHWLLRHSDDAET